MSAETGPGLSYTMPTFSWGTTNQQVNGGFNFDLPLAVIQSFSNQALDYTSANSQANRAFVSSVTQNTQAQVSGTANNAYQYQTAALGTLQGFSQQYGQTVNKAVSAKARSGGFCFITTAICGLDGKPDDCDELQTLRHFRDTVMANDAELCKLIPTYYEIAPGIVQAIDARPDSADIWRQLRDVYLRDAVAAVKQGENEKAIAIYREMVEVAQVFAEEITHG